MKLFVDVQLKEHVDKIVVILNGPYFEQNEQQYYVGAVSTNENYDGSEGLIGDLLGKFFLDRKVELISVSELCDEDIQTIVEAVQQIIEKIS